MCEYCKNLETGNDWKAIKSVFVDFGIAGTVELYAALQRNKKGKPSIALGIDNALRTTDDVVEDYKQIKYCPMCGRKLV